MIAAELQKIVMDRLEKDKEKQKALAATSQGSSASRKSKWGGK